MTNRRDSEVTAVIPDSARVLVGPEILNVVRDLLAARRAVRFTVRTSHMCPCIKTGDTVTLSPLAASPRTGDVIAYAGPAVGGLIIQRVVGQRNGYYLARSDACIQPTQEVPQAWMLGRVSEITRDGKPATFGLGSERVILGLMSRWGLVAPLLRRRRS